MAVTFLIPATIAVEVLIAGAADLLKWPFWLDEYHTTLLVTQGNWHESLRALQHGADFNPPLLYLGLRVLHAAGLPLSPLSLRVISLLTACIALMLLFRVLARRLGPLLGAIGVAAVWVCPAMAYAAFQARFYGPMLLFAALIASVVESRRIGIFRRLALLLVLTAALCTVHWFGIIAAGLAACGIIAWCMHQRRRPPFWLFGFASGPAAVLVCVPILRGQRAALTVPTWVPRARWSTVLGFILNTYIPVELLAVAGVVAATIFALRRVNGEASTRSTTWHEPSHAPGVTMLADPGASVLAAYALLPLVLIVFSFVVQSVLVDRYAIVAALGVGALLADILSKVPRLAQAGALAVLLVLGQLQVMDAAASNRTFTTYIRTTAASVEATVPPRATVVFLTRKELYPLAGLLGRSGRRAVLPDFGPADSVCIAAFAGDACNGLLLERDAARAHRTLFSFPSLATLDSLRRLREFYAVARESPYDSSLLGVFFPGHQITRVALHLVLVRQQGS